VLSPASASGLPNPISSFSLFVAVREPAIYNFFQIANPQPDTFVWRFIYSELDLIFEGIERRLNDSNVVAV